MNEKNPGMIAQAGVVTEKIGGTITQAEVVIGK
jgi:hypothetical protein